jgi:hypothetical protein
MYQVRFSKIKNNHDRLRDDVIIGTCEVLPTVGSPFFLTAPPRDIEYGMRMVNTSEVVTIFPKIRGASKNITIFKTASGSTYSVQVLEQ